MAPRPKIMAASDLPGLLRPGMTVFVQGAASEPLEIAGALAAAPEASRGVHYLGVLIPGVNRVDYAGLADDARSTVFFATPENRASMAAGKAQLLPLPYGGVHAYLKHAADIDLALIQVGPPDARGRCSLGPSVDFVPAALERASLVAAEINSALPCPPGGPTMPYGRIDYACEVDRPLIEVPADNAGAAVGEIGRRVAGLVADGDCIQVGIGKVPNAVLAALAGKNDLGLHSGMLTDALLDLMTGGVITGARKTIDRGRAVVGVALGGRTLYRAAAARPDLAFRPVDYTHDVRVVAQIENFRAINSVLEIDLSGQATAETIAGRQVSGTGGLPDFVRGAALGRGGRSILALTATAAGGTVSRIVPSLAPGTAVTLARTEIDYVVTEYGAARLKHLTLADRAAALIEIAAPKFRDWLRDASRGPS